MKKIYKCILCDVEFSEEEYNDDEALVMHLFSKHFELARSLARGIVIPEDPQL